MEEDDIPTFAARIKAKYPDYASVDDYELVEKVVRKHPVYASQVKLPEGFGLLYTSSGYGKIDSIYEEMGRKYNVDPNLLLEQGRQETSFNPDVFYGKRASSAGAVGAGQFMPGTAPKYGVTDRTDPIQSIEGQAKYMRKLLDDFDNDESLALAGYNAGEYRKALTKDRRVPNIPETQHYVKTIKEKLDEARSKSKRLRDFIQQSPSVQAPTPTTQPTTQPTPEAPSAFEAQLTVARDPKNMARSGVFFPNDGTNAALKYANGLDGNWALFPDKKHNGTHLINLTKAKKLKLRTPKEIQEFIDKNPNAFKTLGIAVEDVGNDTQGVAITAENNGVERASAVVRSPETAVEQINAYQKQFPDATIRPTTTDEIVQNRIATLGGTENVPPSTEPPMTVAGELMSDPRQAEKTRISQAEQEKTQAALQARFAELRKTNPSLTVDQFNQILSDEHKVKVEKSKQEWLAKNPALAKFAKEKNLDPFAQETVDEYNTSRKKYSATKSTAKTQFDKASFNQANKFLREQGQPELSREEFIARQEGNSKVGISLDPNTFTVDGTKITDYEIEAPAQGGGTIRFPREVGKGRDANGTVAVYRSEKGMSEEDAYRAALLNAGSRYGVTPEQVNAQIDKLKSAGKKLFQSGKHIAGNMIAVTWDDLANAGVDVNRERRMEQSQNTLVPAVDVGGPQLVTAPGGTRYAVANKDTELPTLGEFVDQILGDRDQQNNLTEQRKKELEYRVGETQEESEAAEFRANVLKSALANNFSLGESEVITGFGLTAASYLSWLGAGGADLTDKIDPFGVLSGSIVTNALFGRSRGDFLGKFGNKVQKLNELSTPDNSVYKIYREVGNVAGALPAYAAVGVAVGGNPVLTFAITDALVAKGKGGSLRDTIGAGAKGAVMGAMIGNLSRFGTMAADGLLGESLLKVVPKVKWEKSIDPSVRRAISRIWQADAIVQSGGSEAIAAKKVIERELAKSGLTLEQVLAAKPGAVTGAEATAAANEAAKKLTANTADGITTEIDRVAGREIARGIIEYGVPIGLATGIGYGVSAIEGGSTQDNLKNALLFGAMQALGSIFHKKKGEKLTPDEVNKADGTVVRVPDEKGKPHDLILLKENNELTVTDVTGKVPPEAIQGAVLPKPPTPAPTDGETLISSTEIDAKDKADATNVKMDFEAPIDSTIQKLPGNASGNQVAHLTSPDEIFDALDFGENQVFVDKFLQKGKSKSEVLKTAFGAEALNNTPALRNRLAFLDIREQIAAETDPLKKFAMMTIPGNWNAEHSRLLDDFNRSYPFSPLVRVLKGVRPEQGKFKDAVRNLRRQGMPEAADFIQSEYDRQMQEGWGKPSSASGKISTEAPQTQENIEAFAEDSDRGLQAIRDNLYAVDAESQRLISHAKQLGIIDDVETAAALPYKDRQKITDKTRSTVHNILADIAPFIDKFREAGKSPEEVINGIVKMFQSEWDLLPSATVANVVAFIEEHPNVKATEAFNFSNKIELPKPNEKIPPQPASLEANPLVQDQTVESTVVPKTKKTVTKPVTDEVVETATEEVVEPPKKDKFSTKPLEEVKAEGEVKYDGVDDFFVDEEKPAEKVKVNEFKVEPFKGKDVKTDVVEQSDAVDAPSDSVEAQQLAEYKQQQGELRKTDDSVKSFVQKNKDRSFSAPLQGELKGKSVILHPSTRGEGLWQASFLDKDGEPFRDTVFSSYKQAVDEIVRQYNADLSSANVHPSPTNDAQTNEPKSFVPQTANTTTRYDVGAQGTFKLDHKSGASVTGYFKNADMPNGPSLPTRGELFYAETPANEQRKGIATSLAKDALRLMQLNGATTVTMNGTTEAGRKLIQKLQTESWLGDPIQTSTTGKTEYPIQGGMKNTPSDSVEVGKGVEAKAEKAKNVDEIKALVKLGYTLPEQSKLTSEQKVDILAKGAKAEKSVDPNKVTNAKVAEQLKTKEGVERIFNNTDINKDSTVFTTTSQQIAKIGRLIDITTDPQEKKTLQNRLVEVRKNHQEATRLYMADLKARDANAKKAKVRFTKEAKEATTERLLAYGQQLADINDQASGAAYTFRYDAIAKELRNRGLEMPQTNPNAPKVANNVQAPAFDADYTTESKAPAQLSAKEQAKALRDLGYTLPVQRTLSDVQKADIIAKSIKKQDYVATQADGIAKGTKSGESESVETDWASIVKRYTHSKSLDSRDVQILNKLVKQLPKKDFNVATPQNSGSGYYVRTIKYLGDGKYTDGSNESNSPAELAVFMKMNAMAPTSESVGFKEHKGRYNDPHTGADKDWYSLYFPEQLRTTKSDVEATPSNRDASESATAAKKKPTVAPTTVDAVSTEKPKSTKFTVPTKSTGKFEAVKVEPYTQLEHNKFKPNEQLKFNQGTYYEPVRLIADPDLIELISAGAKFRNGKGNQNNETRIKELEQELGIKMLEAHTLAKSIAKENRDTNIEVFVHLGNPSPKAKPELQTKGAVKVGDTVENIIGGWKGTIAKNADGDLVVKRGKEVWGDYSPANYVSVESDVKSSDTPLRSIFPNAHPDEIAAVEAAGVEVDREGNLKRWFGDSKVVDENGNPLAVVHGTGNPDIEIFDTKQGGERKSKQQLDFGSHFTADTEYGSGYAGEINKKNRPNVVKVYLSLQNPLDLTDHRSWLPYVGDANFGSVSKLAKALGLKPNVNHYYTRDGVKQSTIQNVSVTQADLDRVAPAKARQALKDAGYDGVIYEPYNTVGLRGRISHPKSYIALERNQIKSAIGNNGNFDPAEDSILRSINASVEGNAFYSRVESVINDKMPPKATPAQVAALLAKNSVKELDPEFQALKVWLDDQGNVSKEDVLAFVAANRTAVSEVVKGDNNDLKWTAGDNNEFYLSGTDIAISRQDNGTYDVWMGGIATHESVKSLDEAKAYGDEVATEEYKNPDNVKFAQWQLPGESENYREEFLTAPTSDADWLKRYEKHLRDNQSETGYTDAEIESYLQKDNPTSGLENFKNRLTQADWKDGHSDYDDIVNPIARIRYNDRTTSDGDKMLFAEEIQQPSKENLAKMPKVYQKFGEEMAIRKMLYRAVEGEYDYFGFTTGQQQADRYDLSKQIKAIKWLPSEGVADTTIVRIFPNEGKAIAFTVGKDGKVTSSFQAGARQFEGKDLADVVGKDVAEKIAQSAEGRLEGLDLKVGGEGLINRYDRKHVDYINKLMKPYGVSVESKEIVTGNDTGLYITEEPNNENGKWVVRDGKGLFQYATESKQDAGRWVLENPDGIGKRETIHAVRISPEFRAAVEESINSTGGAFPLFKIRSSEDVDALYNVLPYIQNTGDLLEFANGGTITDGELELSPYDAEVTRRLLAEVQKGTDVPASEGAVYNASTLNKMAKVAEAKSAEMTEMGYPKSYTDNLDNLAKNLRTIASNAKHGILYTFDESLPEERFHLEDLSAGRTSKEAIEQMKQSPLWDASEKFNRDYGKLSDRDKASEIVAKLATGQEKAYGWDKIDNFEAERAKLFDTWIDGVIAQNNITNIEAFNKEFTRLGAVYAEAKTNKDRTNKEGVNGNTGVQGGTSEGTNETRGQSEEGGRVQDRAVQEEGEVKFTPGGKEKESKAPKTLQKRGFPVKERIYTSTTNAERTEFANKQLDKGVDEAKKWAETQLDDENYNAGATGVVGINVLIQLGKEKRMDEFNKFADKLMPAYTDAGQMVQSLAIVSIFSPETAPVYLAKMAKKNGKTVTQEQLDKATNLAERMSESSQAMGVTEAAYEAEKQFNELLKNEIDELEKALNIARSEGEELAKKNKELRTQLAGKGRKIASLERKLEGSLPKTRLAGEVAKKVKEIDARKDDILARLAAKFGENPVLRMIAGGDNILRSSNPPIDQDVKDWATWYLGNNIGKITVQQFKDALNTITNGAFSADELARIHADAVNELRVKHTPMDAEKRVATALRNSHYREADRLNEKPYDVFGQDVPKPARRFANAVVTHGIRNGFTPQEIWLTIARKAHPKVSDALKAFRAEFPEVTREEERQVIKRSQTLTNDVKAELDSATIQKKSEDRLSQEDIDLIKNERSALRNAQMKISSEANTFYNSLVKSKTQVIIETLVNARRANLLTAVKSHFVNIGGNVDFGISEELSRVPSTMIDTLAGVFTGERTTTFAPKGIIAGFKSLIKQDETLANAKWDTPDGRSSGLNAAKHIWAHGGSLEDLERLQHAESALSATFKGTLPKAIDFYVNKTFRALGAEDALFKVYAFRRHIEEQARAIALTEHKTDKSVNVKERTAELVANPTNVMQVLADQYAHFMTFQNDNIISTKIAGIKRSIGYGGKAAIETIMPYDRTPTNIVLRTLEYTPAGYAIGGAKFIIGKRRGISSQFRNDMTGAAMTDVAQDFASLPDTEKRQLVEAMLNRVYSRSQQEQFAKTMGRASVGTGLFTLGFVLAAAGLMAGSMSPDDDDRKETNEFFRRMQLGVDNSSLAIPGVGRITLPKSPATVAMTAGATLYEQMVMSKKSPTLAAINASNEAFWDLASEQPLINSTTNLMRTFGKGKLGEFTGNLLSGFVPASALVRSISEVGDAKARTGSGYKKGEKIVTFEDSMRQQQRGFKNSFLRGIPVARNYFVDESTAAVSDAERGGAMRRFIRQIDPFNFRSKKDKYVPPKAR